MQTLFFYVVKRVRNNDVLAFLAYFNSEMVRLCGTRISWLKMIIFMIVLQMLLVIKKYNNNNNNNDNNIILKLKRKENQNQRSEQDIAINFTKPMAIQTLTLTTEVISTDTTHIEETNTDYTASPLIEYGEKLETFLDSNEVTKHGIELEWVVNKIRQEAKVWEMTQKLVEKRGLQQSIKKKQILLYMGLLNIGMGQDALTGGPVGELVQWSNLIVGLNILGHNIEIVKDGNQFEQKMIKRRDYDLIIIDYLGLYGISEERYFQNLCKFRILDSFGTDPKYNIRTYEMADKGLYDQYNLPDTRQIWTYYPLTPDNSFLGTMIPSKQQNKTNNTGTIDKKKIALVYGKVASYIQYFPNNINVLQLISEYMEIHLTMSPDEAISSLPFHTINHGILSSKELSELLDQTHLFVGLGFPFIGPGPFDALAHGCTFLQPNFEIPKNRNTDGFFHGKPTMLTLTSQHSYLEQFGDPEYVYTVDYNDIDLVNENVDRIAKREKLSPYIPYEFTEVGYMVRLAILTEKLQTCDAENVALNKIPQTTVADSFDGNNILLLTDGVWSMHSCYSLVNLESKRPFVSIGFDSTIWVWEVKLKLSPTWNTEGHNPLANIDIELLSENGQPLKVRSFVVDRVSIEWLWVNTSDVAHVILYTNVNISICEFEVYSSEAYKQLWPSIDKLEVKHSKPGESCSTTCFTHDRICARNLFPMLDTTEYFEQHFDCKGYRTDRIGPAIDDSHSFPQDCIQNTDPMQYNCIEKQDSVIRICPCVLKHPGQNGIPFTNDYT